MAKWKVGDVVQHKSTGDQLLILHVRCEEEVRGNCSIPQIYVVRLPNYQRADIEEFELQNVQSYVPRNLTAIKDE